VANVVPLAPVRIAGSDIHYAPGMKAGNWVILTGHEATDHQHGLPAEVIGKPGLPLHGAPKHRREGDYILRRCEQLLTEAGTDLDHAVRLDQYYPTWKAVDPYHHSRMARFKRFIPPSTSVLMSELLTRGADIDVSLVAVMPGAGREIERIHPPATRAPSWSGFVPAVRWADYVFVAGQMAVSGDGALDPRAHVPAHARWGGYEIRKQTDFIIKELLAPALAAAGSSLGSAVKAQAYLQNVEDIPHFLEVWNASVGERTCALSIVPTASFGLVDGIVEINMLALVDGGATRKEIIQADIPPAAVYGAPAVKAGDLLLLSGLLAVDEEGAVASIAAGERMPYFGLGARAQMRHVLEQADRVCGAAGASLANVVRALQFHTDLAEFYPAQRVWQEALPGQPIPFGAIRVPAPMPAPGCTMMVDLWVYAG
jgi:enamine deaminase RidA (YjgF/YER057c/UK114 family)